MSPNPRGGGPNRPGGPTQRPQGEQGGEGRSFPFWYIFLGALLLAVIYWAATREDRVGIGYGEFRRLASENKVESCVLQPDQITGELKTTGPDGKPVRFTTLEGKTLTVSGAETNKFATTWALFS